MLDLFSPKIRSPAECIIEVDGSPIDDLYPMLNEVRVEATRSEGTVATLTFETRRDEKGRWLVQDREILVPWARIAVKAAFGARKEDVFQGFVREVSADYPGSADDARVTVECRDASLALDREHVRFVWAEKVPMSDKAIVTKIAGRHQLTVDPDSGEGQRVRGMNQDKTDYRFLIDRAEANGYELRIEGDELYFGPMRLSADPQETIMVHAGPDTSCQRLSVKSDGHWPEKIAFDVAKTEGAGSRRRTVTPDLPLLGKKPASGGGDGLRDFVWMLSRTGASNEEELAALAQKKANEASLRVKAEGELDGSIYGHVLRVGRPVGVDGIGDWLGGVYYVDHVTHVFSMSGYRQAFRLLRNGYGDDLPGGGSGRLGGIL